MNGSQISLLAAFVAARVEFAVVGGVAVNLHGYFRATQDIDIFIRPTLENAQKAFHALLTIGAPLDGLEAADLLNDEENLRFGASDDHIDILASIGEMPFDQVWRNRIETEVDGLRIPFISLDDLIANKQQVGRLRDLADVEELVRAKKQNS
jgi:predicted nucleotidyltransferase